MTAFAQVPRFLHLAFVLVVGCQSGGQLVVDVRTDFVPGEEFDAVIGAIEGAEPLTLDAPSDGDALRRGVRLGTFAINGNERFDLRVELRRNESVVATRNVSLAVSGTQAVTVVFSSLCRGVECPGAGDDASATECVEGQCVDPECTPETPERCGDLGCNVDGDCEAPALAECARIGCVANTCTILRDDSGCDAQSFCDPTLGCTPRCGSRCEAGECREGTVECDGPTRTCADPMPIEDGRACTDDEDGDGVCQPRGICEPDCVDSAPCSWCPSGDCTCVDDICTDVVRVRGEASGDTEATLGCEPYDRCEVQGAGPTTECEVRCPFGTSASMLCRPPGERDGRRIQLLRGDEDCLGCAIETNCIENLDDDAPSPLVFRCDSCVLE